MRRCTLFSFPCHLKMEVDHAGLYVCTNRHRHTSWDTLISFHHYHHVISVRSNYSELTHNHQQFTVEALFNSVGTNKWNEMKNVDRNMRKTNVFHYIKKLFRSTLSSRNNVQWVTCVRTKYKHTVQANQQVVICFEIENQQFYFYLHGAQLFCAAFVEHFERFLCVQQTTIKCALMSRNAKKRREKKQTSPNHDYKLKKIQWMTLAMPGECLLENNDNIEFLWELLSLHKLHWTPRRSLWWM
jgi:hypothetical protein